MDGMYSVRSAISTPTGTTRFETGKYAMPSHPSPKASIRRPRRQASHKSASQTAKHRSPSAKRGSSGVVTRVRSAGE